MKGATMDEERLMALEARVLQLEAKVAEDNRILMGAARHVLEVEKCIKGMMAADAAARSALINLMASDLLRLQNDLLPPPSPEAFTAMRENVAAEFLASQRQAFLLASDAKGKRNGSPRG